MARRRKKKGDWKSTVRRDVPLSSRRANARRHSFEIRRAYRPAAAGRTPTPGTDWYYRRFPSKPPLSINYMSNVGSRFQFDATQLPFVGRTIGRIKTVKGILKNPIICGKRYIRKQVLFSLGIAGKLLRSPGRGGTYKRTPESRISCT